MNIKQSLLNVFVNTFKGINKLKTNEDTTLLL